MAINDPYKDFIERSRGRVFTVNEAIDAMKALDRFPTTHTINWVSAKTGKPVVIGWTR